MRVSAPPAGAEGRSGGAPTAGTRRLRAAPSASAETARPAHVIGADQWGDRVMRGGRRLRRGGGPRWRNVPEGWRRPRGRDGQARLWGGSALPPLPPGEDGKMTQGGKKKKRAVNRSIMLAKKIIIKDGGTVRPGGAGGRGGEAGRLTGGGGAGRPAGFEPRPESPCGGTAPGPALGSRRASRSAPSARGAAASRGAESRQAR